MATSTMAVGPDSQTQPGRSTDQGSNVAEETGGKAGQQDTPRAVRHVGVSAA